MVNLKRLPKMKKITQEAVFEKRKLKPRRICFASNSGIQKKKKNDSKSFSVSFSETIKPIFEAETGLELKHSKQYKNCYRVIESAEELKLISSFEKKQGSHVFLRDCLSLSIALDMNLTKPGGERTHIGSLEYNGKKHEDENAINELAKIATQTIVDLPYYKSADLICSVPSHPNKNFDLPSKVTSIVSMKIKKQDVTKGFVFSRQKSSAKTLTLDQKWNAWEEAKISFQNGSNFKVNDKTVILIDDKYQSGITIQYIAMKLQEAGVREVYGLNFVKTLRDTGNT